ncbi:uncharacterized protein LOC117638924 [Thrips palmi]|uniref:Uncharacterized protein LOC117638924 n=1 Tax=Thrips palmi TaxID=161013 RepID=A0A6P8Y8J6_THRPL|nr:uncharacterized protein LOC117638924 [Thrips palmi]
MAVLSSEQECSLDDLIKERLKSCRVTPKGMITGYLESKKAYDELFRDLKVLGCRYSVRSCYAGKADSGNLQYKILSPDLQIPFTGSPFHVEGTTYFLCTHGFRYFKSKVPPTADENSESDNSTTKKKRRKTNESIKLGCPAKMTVKCIRVYPDYKTPADSWRRKSDLLKKLKADMKSTPPPRQELNYWISVSPESAHTHKRTTTQRIQPLHPDLISEIHNLVRRGVTSVPTVKSQLSKIVSDMFLKSSIRPDHQNSAFYPSDKCIYNHIYDARVAVSKLQDEGKMLDPNLISLPASTEDSFTHQDHQIPAKCDPDSTVVPVLDTFTHEWQDHTVLPSNFVQVLNSNGTLMLMVTQPISEEVVGHENSTEVDAANLVSVNLDDNIYHVITGPSEERILPLNDDENILMTQTCSDHDQINEVLAMQESEETVILDSDKNGIDFDGVMSMEGTSILGIQNSPHIVEDRDDTSCHDDRSQFLFVEEDSQTELLKEVKCQNRDFSELCTLPPVPSLSPKDHEASLFPSALGTEDSEKTMDEVCGLDTEGETDKQTKTKRLKRKHSETDTDSSTLISSRRALRECAQDIINMSYWSTDTILLQEMLRVFEKYRTCVREELEAKKKLGKDEFALLQTSPGKSRWKSSSKSHGLTAKTLFQSASQKESRQSSKKLRNIAGTLFSSSESSVGDYEDLVIND